MRDGRAASARRVPRLIEALGDSHVFHIEVDGDPNALALALIANGWTTVERLS